MPNPFYIVDVFAERKYRGNQLAVVNCHQALSKPEMQKIACEMHFSETTFILSEKPRDGGYDVRIFTPQTEVPFAGHPTLGTAYILQREIIKKPLASLTLNLKVGHITVRFTGNGMLWMKQVNPTFGQLLQPDFVTDSLGIPRQEIDDRFPVQVVSTGLPFVIIPVNTLNYLSRVQISRERYARFITKSSAGDILIFCSEVRSPRNHLHVRVFAIGSGVPEDPATGSGNGCLAAYLIKHRYYSTNRLNIRVEQGEEIGRPSRLYLKAREVRGGIDVHVGGKVLMVASGKLV